MIDIEADLASIGLQARPEQILMANWMTQDAADGQISLVEAPPASGKTLAMVWHALGLSARTGDRVLISVPTLAVMRQTLKVGRLLADGTGTNVAIAAIHGRQEYVSPDAAEAWLTGMAPHALPAFREWRTSQDESGWTKLSLDDAFREAGYEIDLPVETTLLARRHSDAEAAYRRQYETDAGVLICTHVLLARDVATRVGRRAMEEADLPTMVAANERRLRDETAEDRILPEWRHLVVDEAHQLAAGFMMALTSRLSFRRLLAILDERVAAGVEFPAKTLATLRAKVDLFENANDEGTRSRRLSMDLRHDRALVRSVEQCIPEDPATLGVTEEEANYLRRFRDAAALAQRARSRVAPSITWSDVHRVLGLSVTPVSFGRHLDFCFRSCRSVALLSATLYAHDDEEPHDHLARQLMLPVERVRAHPPIESDWLTRDVTLVLPEGEMAADLDPKRRDWAYALAETIALAAEDSTRGMLVLATSHRTIEDLQELLEEDHGDRLIVTDERGVGPTAQRFVEAARAGMRPVWLATGPAWTGLDLPGDVLDGLLVTRLPFGLSNPIMHEHLMGTVRTKAGFRDAETDMLKTLKQGIGRLVRDRENVRPRMLWIADGRISGHVAGARALAMLEIYPERTSFDR